MEVRSKEEKPQVGLSKSFVNKETKLGGQLKEQCSYPEHMLGDLRTRFHPRQLNKYVAYKYVAYTHTKILVCKTSLGG